MKYMDALEDAKQIMVESGFASRWATIQGYHELGTLIIQNALDINLVANYVQKPLESVTAAVRFAQQYPSLDDFSSGKNIGWSTIKRMYLETKPPAIKPAERTR